MSRAGLRYSPLSDVTASQPAKAHTSSAAAEPTASQPCGANGVRLPMSAWGSETSVAASSSPPRTNAMTSCTRPLTRSPNQFITVTRPMIPPVATSWVCPATAERVGDVRRGEAGRGRRPDRDREVEAPADHGGGARAEGLARVRRDAAAVGVAGAQRRERRGQRNRQQEQRRPGEQRRGAGRRDSQRGQRDHAGAEHRADGHARRPAGRRADRRRPGSRRRVWWAVPAWP